MAEARLRIRPGENGGFRTNREIPAEWMPQLKKLFDFLGKLKRLREELRWDIRMTEELLDVALIMNIGHDEKSFSKNIPNWKEGELANAMIDAIASMMLVRAETMIGVGAGGWLEETGKALAILSVYKATFPIEQAITMALEDRVDDEPDRAWDVLAISMRGPGEERVRTSGFSGRYGGSPPPAEAICLVQEQLQGYFGGLDE